MDRPGEIEEIQLVAILRTLKKHQDEVAETLKMRKERVVSIEIWLRTISHEQVVGIFEDNRRQKVIDNKLTALDILPVDLVQASRLTTDDILQRYRGDYPLSPKPLREINEQLSEHYARIGKVAEALRIGLNFSQYIEGENAESRYGGVVWGNWKISRSQLRDSKFVELPEIHFSAEASDLFDYLIKPMDAEFSNFSIDFNKFKGFAVGELSKLPKAVQIGHPELKDHSKTQELRQKLWLVIERGIFNKDSCDICKDWS